MGRVQDSDGSRGYARGGPRRRVTMTRGVVDYQWSAWTRTWEPVIGAVVHVSGICMGTVQRRWERWTLTMYGPEGTTWTRSVPVVCRSDSMLSDEERTKERVMAALRHVLAGDWTGWERVES